MGNGNISLKQAALWCGGTVAPAFAEVSFCGANFDSRNLQAGELFVAVTGARNGHDFIPDALEKGAAAVLVSEPVREDIPAIYVSDTVAALQDIARGYRESLSLLVVGVTGSVGKTTTKEMIAAVLGTTYRTQKTPENFNNGLGLPVTVLSLDRADEAAVLEMGMNHFGEIALLTRIAQPDIAVITNIGTMHMENLGSREGILQAKLEILEGLRPGGIAVFNGDNDLLSSVAERYHAVTFGLGGNNDVRAVNITTENDTTHFTAVAFGTSLEITLPAVGEHNILNALAAIAVGLKCGVAPERIEGGLADFRNTGMRQHIYDCRGVKIIEDCYNAGPESMEAALSVLGSYPGRKIAALGGMLELGPLAPQAHYRVGTLAAQTADVLFAYGANSEQTVRGALDAGMKNAKYFESHEELAQALKAELRAGDNLLVKGSRGMKMERVLRLLDMNDGGTQHG